MELTVWPVLAPQWCSRFEFENAVVSGVKTHFSIGKICVMKSD